MAESKRGQVLAGIADISIRVADDAVAQYETAKRQRGPIQVWAQAGMVSASWLQAETSALRGGEGSREGGLRAGGYARAVTPHPH